MDLVRNVTIDGSCKYSLIEHEKGDHIEQGLPYSENEFFVLKLKDKYAQVALNAYAEAAAEDDPEYARQVKELANRASEDSPWCKKPDSAPRMKTISLSKCVKGQKLLSKHGLILTYIGALPEQHHYDHEVEYPCGASGSRTDDGHVFRRNRRDTDHDIIEILD